MAEELDRRLLDDILTTGFPTELRTHAALEAAGWRVSGHRFYLDEDEQKGREVDLDATRNSFDHQGDPSVCVWSLLSIEVKKSRKPWVVFTSPRDTFCEPGTGYGMLINTSNAGPDELPYEVMMRNHPASSRERLGRTLYVAFSSAENGSAFGAAVSACKAAYATHRQAAKRMETDDWRGDSVDVTFYCPVVVLDGQLYECHLDSSSEPVLTETAQATLSLNYLSPAYGDRTYLVDIVTTGHVSEYSRSHHEWLRDMRAHIVQTVRR